jgi:hypothetical protein
VAGSGVVSGGNVVEVVVVDSTTGAAGLIAAVVRPVATLARLWLAHAAPKSASSTAAVAIRRANMA